MDYQTADHLAGDARQSAAVAPATGPDVAQLGPWRIFVVGLVVGILAGFFGRPLVTPRPSNDPAAVAAVEAPGQAVEPPAVMAAVMTQTRHFKGDAQSPVTVIEFGDFQ